MNTKHTPGPWTSERMILPPKEKDRRSGFVVNGPEANGEPLPVRVCDLRVPIGMGGFSEGQANAKLIAASPDLLQALKDIVELAHRGDGDNRVLDSGAICHTAWNAIEKATA